MADEIPWYLRPAQYTGEPEIPRAGNDDKDPIDYTKGPDRGIVFGDDIDDDNEPEEDIDS